MATNYRKLDWISIALYLVLVIFGWMNIYSSSSEDSTALFDFSSKYGMHMIWIATAFILAATIILFVPHKVFSGVAWPVYFLVALLLLAVAFFGIEVNGSKSWFALGPVRFQPAEFSKISTSLALAYLMSKYNFSFTDKRETIKAFATILVPIFFILLEKETGSALVYLGFLLVFYREGMSGWLLLSGLLAILLFILTLITSPYVAIIVLMGLISSIVVFYSKHSLKALIIGILTTIAVAFLPKLITIEFIASITDKPQILIALITAPIALTMLVICFVKRNTIGRNVSFAYICGLLMILSVQFVFENVLQDHQRARIEVLLGIREDPMGVGYNVHQSMIAIGSGKFLGKGYLNGTQTHFNFVPEQSTDFIFCTIGEEWGFLGAIAILAVYLALILRILSSAEKQNDRFTRIYGYCTASCLLMHVFINISMTIGLMPVIGIPLPFLSYGGSSLWAFTILLFIYFRLDVKRWNYY